MRHSVAVTRHETRRQLPAGHVPYYDDRPWRPEHGLVPAPWVESAEADGWSCCSPEDLATYLRALWRGSPLLNADSLSAMTSPSPPEDEEPYGYGLEIHPDGFGHTGDMLGHVAYMRADTSSGIGVVAFANGFRGAWWLGEGALALATGREPPAPALDAHDAVRDDGSCPEARSYLGRYRAHNPWLPTFAVGASGGRLVMGTDWMNGSARLPLTPMADTAFRVGEEAWSPERLRFDAVVDGRAQRAVLSGTPYYRAHAAAALPER
jgi:hypothetical protein